MLENAVNIIFKYKSRGQIVFSFLDELIYSFYTNGISAFTYKARKILLHTFHKTSLRLHTTEAHLVTRSIFMGFT